MVGKRFCGFLMVACAFSLSFLSVVLADPSGATDAISDSRSQIIACYEAARDAEAAGANITLLTATLNVAGSLLSRAQSAFSNGDFASAEDLAVQCQNTLIGFVEETNALSVFGTARRDQDFLLNVVGSMGGTVAVLVGSLGLWHFLKKRFQEGGAREIEFTEI